MITFSVRVLYGRRQHGTEGGRRPGLRRRVHTEKPRPQGRNPPTHTAVVVDLCYAGYPGMQYALLPTVSRGEGVEIVGNVHNS